VPDLKRDMLSAGYPCLPAPPGVTRRLLGDTHGLERSRSLIETEHFIPREEGAASMATGGGGENVEGVGCI